MAKNDLILDVHEKPSIGKWILLSFQHVFAMVGATILVPIITGLPVGVALVASGLGTIIYILCTRGKVPIYLGSSFAYITAILVARGYDAVSETYAYGPESAYIGLMGVGIIYAIIATIIRFTGSEWLKKLLPPVVIGPMIIVIGLNLAPVAIKSAGLNGGQGWKVPLVAFITFVTVIVVSLLGKGFFRIVPFLIAIIVGYISSVIFGLVDVAEAFADVNLLKFDGWFQIPEFVFVGSYKPDFSSLLMFAPIAFVTIAEHIGDHTVLGEITNRDYIKDPGLDKTIMGDGLATLASAMIGGPANTSYGENTGVVAMTKVASVWVTGLAAIFAIILGFIQPVQLFVRSINPAVIGGMTVILYGLIAGNGVKVLVKNKVDLGVMRNLIIVATMLVIGLGGAEIKLNDAVSVTGMSLAALVGIILNLVLPKEKIEA